MTELYSIVDTGIWYLLGIVSLIMLVGSISVLLRAVFDSRNKRTIAFAVTNLVITLFVFIVLNDCSSYTKIKELHIFLPFEEMLFSLPYLFYVGVELVSGVLLLICIRDSAVYRKSNLTSDSIKEALDILPEGIVIGNHDGMVRLSNLKMNELCKVITSDMLNDTGRFWNTVSQKGKEQGGKYLMHVNESVWQFEKDKLDIDGIIFDQITATDVTDRYKIIDELEAKNEHLQDIRRRMKAVSELSGDMFVAQEEAAARAAVHNQLGQVLLMGRHYINHRDAVDSQVVYAATKQMNQFLLGESKEAYLGEEDALNQACHMADSIGVKVVINGTDTKKAIVRDLLSQAITECAANTVKHAEGNKVIVDITEDEDKSVITVTNNGKPPKNAISESGGLLSLRRNVEAIGGVMTVEYTPEFKLTLKV